MKREEIREFFFKEGLIRPLQKYQLTYKGRAALSDTQSERTDMTTAGEREDPK